MKTKYLKATIILSIFLTSQINAFSQSNYHSYVDPFIGTQGDGNVVIGPSCPFGMIKPGPDYSLFSNNGYMADITQPLLGFSQIHVSGTGGGAKYGNISVMPFGDDIERDQQTSLRENEKAALGYYGVTLKKWNIEAELTATNKVAFYRFRFNNDGTHAVKIDAGKFLNEGNGNESQSLVGSEIEIISDREVKGYNRVRGGWNAGGPYTVFFYAVFDKPFIDFKSWKGTKLYPGQKLQFDSGEKTGALLFFKNEVSKILQMKVAVSFVSTAKAKQNMDTEVPAWNFEKVLNQTQQKWEKLLSRIELDKTASAEYKKMFYTGLYHTMLMPVDRSDENPLWKSDLSYYDDFYAIWDTFRSSSPLITLIDPLRQTAIVNSLLNIYQHDGYMPDARSGNSNGRTQGGSNADVIIADAYVKGLKGIDYNLALKAMLKNADVPPGGNEEREGRGGLIDYNKLGYVSNAYPRSGTRTVEYAFDDYCIAEVAKGLGETALYKRFIKQADNWQNLWRDIEDHGAKGFIMPKDAQGGWIDSLDCTITKKKMRFYPTEGRAGVCVCWWCGFLYEGTSWDYSFFVPHDVASLINRTGGKEAFNSRLDTFFNKRFYSVGNEPDFLTPDFYHWIGKPDKSSDRIRKIISGEFNASRKGLPGNDDSGAMSSWLAFHMIGLYPNAGQSYYLINSPLVKKSTIHLEGNKSLKIIANNFSDNNVYIKSVWLNGKPFLNSWIEHNDLIKGGTLEFEMAAKPGNWGTSLMPPSKSNQPALP
jgi:predicted alpha-1,2-mannosidase